MKASQNQIKLLENQLDKQLKAYNDLQADSRNLRTDIDVCRKQQKNQLRVNVGLSREIQVTVNSIKKLNNFTYQGQRVSEETHNQILALKAKHETDKLNFETKIMDLQQKLQERDDNELDRTRSRDLKKEKENGGVVEFSNPAALLKNRL